ncbi:MAG: putative Serine/threonine-protein kinase OSR1 [Streblomastix strix]|uniref:Putative Serine/threonine-protein kinase OSR1 n=1 Tax=Streblomastix strix TaxID=222440 RepID=A0A5J4V8W9_9EUKA|nr:MAG: putative Serine/threonine-protein kinase OSR1 [Streblomastix strix]
MEDFFEFPARANGYKLLYEIGQGSSAKVWRANCVSLNQDVAIKIIDLEKVVGTFDTVLKEIRVLSSSKHKNISNILISFVNESELWLVMPLFVGSCLAIMRAVFKHGFNEHVIAVILRSSVRALEYIHNQGQIHRDVKAGNLLISALGTIALSDFGVSGLLIENGERKQERRTFVGTPCWMAPELIDINLGYDSKIDIWAIGITAVELANGKAPLSDLPPMKVLTMILKGPPPILTDNEVDNESDSQDSSSDSDSDSDDAAQKQKKQKTAKKQAAQAKPKPTSAQNLLNELNDLDDDDPVAEDGQSRTSWAKVSVQKHIQSKLISNSKPFSNSFKDFVQQCLQTDPKKRPSASKLLEHKFLSRAKGEEILLKEILRWILPDEELINLQQQTLRTLNKASISTLKQSLQTKIAATTSQQGQTIRQAHDAVIQGSSEGASSSSQLQQPGQQQTHQVSAFDAIAVKIEGASTQDKQSSSDEKKEDSKSEENKKQVDEKDLWDFQIDENKKETDQNQVKCMDQIPSKSGAKWPKSVLKVFKFTDRRAERLTWRATQRGACSRQGRVK